MRLRYFIVDAFTSEPFGGNPAGVVLLDGDFPSERLMQQVAAELRYSETAFVQQQSCYEFTVRYFTPCSEVDLCGHATIASFGVLWQHGLISENSPIVNHTLAGDLMVRIDRQVMMQMAAPSVLDTRVDATRLHRIMAGNSRWNGPTYPLRLFPLVCPISLCPSRIWIRSTP